MADRAGLYYFHQYWSLDDAYSQSFYIRKNGVAMCESYGRSDGTNDYNAHSCSIVIELVAGDVVHVASNFGYDVGWGGSTGFTGFLIRLYI